MTQMPRAFDDQMRAHTSPAPETTNSRTVSGTYPHLQPLMTSPLYVPYQYNRFWPSDPLPPPHHGGSHPPPVTPLLHSLVPVGNESSNYTPLVFPQPFDTLRNPSGAFHSPPNLLFSPTNGNPPPAAYYPTLDPALHSNFPCQQSPWSAEGIQVGSVDDYFPAPSHHQSTVPLSPCISPCTPEDYILGASYPCQWTENGIAVCNVMVQATRSHINRHLHTDHGFCGSDTQQTRCRWAGCEETMQRGSIARHMVTCHLQAKVTCPMCSKKLSRQDVISKHQRVCPAAGAWR